MPTHAFTAAVDGGALVGRREGSGPPALLLHGGPGLSDYTAELAAELRDVVETFRYQQRGLEPSTTTGPFTVERHVADAIAVLDALGLERAYVIGHSWGGHLGMHLALAHPQRLLGLVMVDTLGAVGDGGLAAFEAVLLARTPAADVARAAELDRRAMAGEGTVAEATESLALIWPAYFADPATAPPFPETMRLAVEPYSQTLASLQAQLADGSLARGLAGCAVPALAVHGTDDPMPLSAASESAALFASARTVAIPACGHFPWLEQPGAVAAAVREFVA